MILVRSENLILIEEGGRGGREKGFGNGVDFSTNPKHYWRTYKWEKYTASPDELALINAAIQHSKQQQLIKGAEVADDSEESGFFYSEYTHCYETSTPWGEQTATSESTSKEEAEAYINSLGLNSPEENGWGQLPNGVWEREVDEDRGFFHRVSL